MYNLNGEVALVTGAGGEHGIGRAVANRIAEEGAEIIVNDIVINPYAPHGSAGWEGAPSVVREIEGIGRDVMLAPADVCDVEHMDGMGKSSRHAMLNS